MRYCWTILSSFTSLGIDTNLEYWYAGCTEQWLLKAVPSINQDMSYQSHQVMNGCHIYVIQTCGKNVWDMWLDKLYCLQGRAALTSRVTSTSPPRTFWTTSAERTLVRHPCISDIYLFIYSLLLFTYLLSLSPYYPHCWKQTLKI